jgi:polar amino acid transport system substrate-binding protein
MEVYPWVRAYKMAQTTPNVMLFSILLNPQRENLFKWVGALHPFQVFFSD